MNVKSGLVQKKFFPIVTIATDFVNFLGEKMQIANNDI